MIKPTIMSDDVLIDQGRRGMQYVDRVRMGAREGLLPWSRERQAGQLIVEAERLAAEGNMDRALFCVRRALAIQPMQPDAIRLRERLLSEPTVWPLSQHARGHRQPRGRQPHPHSTPAGPGRVHQPRPSGQPLERSGQHPRRDLHRGERRFAGPGHEPLGRRARLRQRLQPQRPARVSQLRSARDPGRVVREPLAPWEFGGPRPARPGVDRTGRGLIALNNHSWTRALSNEARRLAARASQRPLGTTPRRGTCSPRRRRHPRRRIPAGQRRPVMYPFAQAQPAAATLASVEPDADGFYPLPRGDHGEPAWQRVSRNDLGHPSGEHLRPDRLDLQGEGRQMTTPPEPAGGPGERQESATSGNP